MGGRAEVEESRGTSSSSDEEDDMPPRGYRQLCARAEASHSLNPLDGTLARAQLHVFSSVMKTKNAPQALELLLLARAPKGNLLARLGIDFRVGARDLRRVPLEEGRAVALVQRSVGAHGALVFAESGRIGQRPRV